MWRWTSKANHGPYRQNETLSQVGTQRQYLAKPSRPAFIQTQIIETKRQRRDQDTM